jgi:hypothetical protein
MYSVCMLPWKLQFWAEFELAVDRFYYYTRDQSLTVQPSVTEIYKSLSSTHRTMPHWVRQTMRMCPMRVVYDQKPSNVKDKLRSP